MSEENPIAKKSTVYDGLDPFDRASVDFELNKIEARAGAQGMKLRQDLIPGMREAIIKDRDNNASPKPSRLSR